MRLATWNVNSIKARAPAVLDWLKTAAPDVVMMQEIKCETGAFPALEFEALGYKTAAVGQKSYNGVAVASKRPFELRAEALPGDEDDSQARYIEVELDALIVGGLYLPNGNPSPGPKYDYKLAWMERLEAHARGLLESERPVALGGDYNVIPQAEDCYDPAAWADDALFRPETRRAFRRLLNLGYTEAFASLDGRPAQYSFWDYQGGAWQNDQGIRIDHWLLSPQAADRLQGCEIDRGPRGKPKASDHTPVIVELAD